MGYDAKHGNQTGKLKFFLVTNNKAPFCGAFSDSFP